MEREQRPARQSRRSEALGSRLKSVCDDNAGTEALHELSGPEETGQNGEEKIES